MDFFEELKRRNVIRVGIAYGVTAWVVLQFADLVLDNISAPNWVMHTLMLFVALGFIASLVIAWAYEVTPEGIKRESEVDRENSITQHTAKKLHLVTLGAVVLLIVLLAVDRIIPKTNDQPVPAADALTAEPSSDAEKGVPPAQETLERGVAVLPFSNLSEDPSNAFFAGGVHEDVLTNLSRIPDLRVISRTSMLKIGELGLDIREIGQKLDVSHVLEGSVRRAGNQVRVTVQLIDASNDDHIWAENFDRNLDDIFAIQSEIAQKIAAQLETELSPELEERLSEVPTTDTQAYDLYLKARVLSQTWQGSYGFQQMQPLLEQAIELDPNFLDAQVLLARVYGRLVWTGADPEGIYLDRAKTLTDQIMEQWPGRPESDVAQGNYHYTVERDYQKALLSYQRALQYMPNDSDLLLHISSAYKRLDEYVLGLPIIEKAQSLDPESPLIAAEKTFHLVGAGRDKEAIAYAREAAAKFPNDVSNQANLANYSLFLFGNKREYFAVMENAMQLNPRMVAVTDELAVRMLMTESNLDQQIEQLRQIRRETDFWSSTLLAIRIAELLNLAGREEESVQEASSLLDSVEENLAQNMRSGGELPLLYSANFAYVACLAGDTQAFEQFTEMADSARTVESERQSVQWLLLGRARAECGNTEALWQAAQKVGTNPYSGVTRWQLALDPMYQRYLSDTPEYQEMVKSLQTTKSQPGW